MAAPIVVAMAAVYAWFAAGTRAFTWEADLACAIAFAIMAALALRRRPARLVGSGVRREPREGVPDGAPPGQTPRHGAVTPSGDFRSVGVPAGALWPWAAAVGVLVAWELATYFAGFGGHRRDFPTISSLYDEAVRWRGVKAFFFFLWLALGWGLFGR